MKGLYVRKIMLQSNKRSTLNNKKEGMESNTKRTTLIVGGRH